MIQTDQREGLPSASSMERLLSCPGHLRLAAAINYRPETACAADGTLAHGVLSGEEEEDALEEREDLQEAVARCRALEQEMAEALGFSGAPVLLEERMFLHDDEGEPVASGQPDRVYIHGNRFFIADYKTGRKDQLPPAMNPQLVTYALLVAEAHGVSEGYLAIIPAWRKAPEPAFIDAAGLAAWRAHILDGITAAKQPDAPVNAGRWCDYCPARPGCPSAHALVEEAGAFSPAQQPNPVSPEEELRRFEVCKHAQGTIKVYLDYLAERLQQDGAAVPGLIRKPDTETFKLPGSPELTEALLAQGFTPEQVALCSTVSTTKLAAVATGARPEAKALGKEAKALKRQLEAGLRHLGKVGAKKGALERA